MRLKEIGPVKGYASMALLLGTANEKGKPSFIFYKAFFVKLIQLAQFDKKQKCMSMHETGDVTV